MNEDFHHVVIFVCEKHVRVFTHYHSNALSFENGHTYLNLMIYRLVSATN